MRQQIEDALVGKSVRLARIVATSTAIQNGELIAPMTYDDFKCKNPIEIMQEIYRKKCDGEEMTEELLEKLNEVIKEVQNEDISNKGM